MRVGLRVGCHGVAVPSKLACRGPVPRQHTDNLNTAARRESERLDSGSESGSAGIRPSRVTVVLLIQQARGTVTKPHGPPACPPSSLSKSRLCRLFNGHGSPA